MIQTVDLLLVEDNSHDAELILGILKKNDGFSTYLHLKDGEQVIEYLFAQGQYKDRNKLHLPKLILLDLKLPKINGIELLKLVKDDSIARITPVIILSSSAEQQDIYNAYQYGASCYVVKPVNYHQLKQTLVQLSNFWLKVNQLPRTALQDSSLPAN
jgi:two-component system, response regulator